MSKTDNGGPAYPGPWKNDGDRNCTAPNGEVVAPGNTIMLSGASLRDMFADSAMRALIPEYDPSETIEKHLAWVAKNAYRYADAMLEARKK